MNKKQNPPLKPKRPLRPPVQKKALKASRTPEKPVRHQPTRLNRVLSLAGLTSRRKADEWIKSGRVTVNEEVVREPGAKALWGVDRIQVNGKSVPAPTERLYLMMNKPFGYLSSLEDPTDRPLVTDLLKKVPERVYPIGRLDFDSLGLLLLTNDGELAYRLTHPRYRVPRTYKVTVEGAITDDALEKLRNGVQLEDGRTGRARVTLISSGKGRSILRMTLTQGRNRQVRRMLEAVGHRPIHLIRIGFGNLRLGDLKMGEFRYLEGQEVASLRNSVGLS